MKAKSTIKRELKALREFIEDAGSDELARRIAWEVEQAIRWAREDVRGWDRPLVSTVSCANSIHDEVRRKSLTIGVSKV